MTKKIILTENKETIPIEVVDITTPVSVFKNGNFKGIILEEENEFVFTDGIMNYQRNVSRKKLIEELINKNYSLYAEVE